jgi:AraC family transcriptional regulator
MVRVFPKSGNIVAKQETPMNAPSPSTQPSTQTLAVHLKTLPALRLLYTRYTGPYGHPDIGKTWVEFAAWCGQLGLMPPGCVMVGISHDDPRSTPPEACRYDCAVVVDAAFIPPADALVQTLSAGRYACAEFVGTGQDIAPAWFTFFSEQLPQSGYTPCSNIAIEWYEGDFVVDAATGVFQCLLCAQLVA